MSDIERRAIVVWVASPGNEAADLESNLSELNALLKKGWTVEEVSPMGGAGGGETPEWASLVRLFKEK